MARGTGTSLQHSWSAGVWVQRIHQNSAGAAQASGGNIAYPTVLAMLQDLPSQFIVNRNPIPVGYRTTEGAWYLQDEMKLKSNLTLRLGLRHEMTDGWNEVGGRCSNYRYDPGFVIQTNPTVGYSCLDRNHAKLLLQQFRAEAFNVFNHANFSYPNQVVFSGNDISPSAGVDYSDERDLTATPIRAEAYFLILYRRSYLPKLGELHA